MSISTSSDRPVSIHQGKLVWAGEHWISMLRPEGADERTAVVSLFHTRYSPAGEGNAALVRVGGPEGLHAVCADNAELGRFAIESFFARADYFDPQLPLVEARFSRQGDIRSDPAWVIEAGPRRLVARWHVTEPPVIADGTFRSGTEHFTILFFCEEASVELDGQGIEGRPYSRDLWKPTIGGDRSSCVFALAEALIELPEGSE